MKDHAACDFYDEIANYYDDMTRFKERLVSEKKIMKAWMDKYDFQIVLDAACGSGLHTIVLTQLGVSATGIDISARMIAGALKNAQEMDLHSHFAQAALDEIDQKIKGKFDTVFILGNSLPHLSSEREIKNSLVGLKKILTDKGRLIIQILNYDHILNKKQRVISVSRNSDHEFIRFYDFINPYVRFNVLHIHWQNGNAQHEINSTILYPYTLSEISKILADEGYGIQDLYGSMNFDVYNNEQSKNLIVVAQTN